MAELGLQARVDQLKQIAARGAELSTERRAYLEQHGIAGVQRFRSQGGTRIYALQVETFPRHINNVYLLIDAGSALLFDCGSGMESSRRDLALAFAVVREAFGEQVRYEDLDWCIISHAHFDHFGGASKVRKLDGINFALGGHEEPIWDLRARIDAIALFHRDRLARVKDMCAEPRTVLEIAQEMFGNQDGYSRILALDEAGAHVEYLHAHGQLRIANLDEVASARDPVIQYVAR